MSMCISEKISLETGLKLKNVSAVLELLDEGATVPFISRYRKEVTGAMDEVSIISIRDRSIQLHEIEKRRAFILKSIEGSGKLSNELRKKIETAEKLSELEDLYLPYKPKKKTRAAAAREKGLEPLASAIYSQQLKNPMVEAEKYINPEKNINTSADALAGACDIISETISEDAALRSKLRNHFYRNSVITSGVVKSKISEAVKYKDYFNWSENADKCPSHRILAMIRGFDEGFLKVHVRPDEETVLNIITGEFKCIEKSCYDLIITSSHDAYSRLLAPSLENEVKSDMKKRADREAVRIFAENVKELLLAPPMGGKNILAIDPGMRTGCKIAVLDKSGDLVTDTVMYPLEPHCKTAEASEIIRRLCSEYEIEAIAVGNGTGGKEATAFCRSLDIENVIITPVNESGASVYSASEAARAEFPDHDVTVRGAVSIGRRLMDPLAELVKIDPKSIGVGQYQHDVDQKMLKESLTDTVMFCVNSVGVELNTASVELLKYVSGLSKKTAEEIVIYRAKHGQFSGRSDLKKVQGIGERVFEQAAGFLRVRCSANPLDASAVHPESYHIVEKMAADAGCGIIDLVKSSERRSLIKVEKYVSDNVGMPTLMDIMNELEKPGRDPRESFEFFSFAQNVNSINDLAAGMTLSGIVTNVTAFGAFVDIGVHQDGLVHISEMSDSFVKSTFDVVRVGQKVNVTVLEVDKERSRISLSMKKQ